MKLRRIAAALVIVSLGAASFTFAVVRGQMTDCRITEKTIVGDAAAAAGLSASFGMGLQNQLYWRNVYTYGGADDGADVQETAFSRKNPFPADKKGPVPYVRLENFTASGEVIYSLLPGAKGYSYRQERLSAVQQDFLQPDAVEKLQTIEQQLPEEGREDIKLKEIFRYYPIDGELSGETLIYSVSLADVAFGKISITFLGFRFWRTRAVAFGFKNIPMVLWEQPIMKGKSASLRRQITLTFVASPAARRTRSTSPSMCIRTAAMWSIPR